MQDYDESKLFMVRGLYWYYSNKYPECEKVLKEVMQALEKAMGLENFQSGGGVGMLRGWMEFFQALDEK